MNRAGWFRTAAIVLALGLMAGACGGEAGPGEKAAAFVHIHGLAVDPSDPDVLWVATHRGLIRGTRDGNWTYASRDRNDHMGFTLEPSTGTLFRSGHPEKGGSLGVEASADGESWRKLSDVLSPPVDFHAMTVSFADAKTMYGWDSGGRGLFRSADGGNSWQRASPEGLPPQIFALAAPGEADMVLAGTPAGIFRSDNAAGSWSKIAEGQAYAISSGPKDPQHLLVFLEEGMRVSRDAGSTWATASDGIPTGEFIGAIAISPHQGEVAYAAGATTVFKTTDGGKSWRLIRSGD